MYKFFKFFGILARKAVTLSWIRTNVHSRKWWKAGGINDPLRFASNMNRLAEGLPGRLVNGFAHRVAGERRVDARNSGGRDHRRFQNEIIEGKFGLPELFQMCVQLHSQADHLAGIHFDVEIKMRNLRFARRARIFESRVRVWSITHPNHYSV